MTIMYTNKWKIPFMIDDEDEEEVSKEIWGFSGGYITHWDSFRENNEYLHIFLFGYAPEGLVWDHIDRNTFNNQRLNLRSVTNSEDKLNRSLFINNTSGTKGVCYHIGHNKWQAKIVINQKTVYLDEYVSKEDAIKTRREAEIKYWGKLCVY